MTHELTVYLTAAWRSGEQRGPLRYSATAGMHYGTPNCETFWEAVGELVRRMGWRSDDAAGDQVNGRQAETLDAHHCAA